jgi:hypothetical protein
MSDLDDVTYEGDSAIPPNVFHDVIVSLYWDQIRPYEIDIIRRATEQYGRISPLVEYSNHQLRISDRSRYLVRKDPGRGYFVELVEPPGWFLGWIDPNDYDYRFSVDACLGLYHYIMCIPLGPLPSEAAGVDSGNSSYQFKGGRYGLARRLQESIFEIYNLSQPDRCPDCRNFFESVQFLSLGRLCQLVQWGISIGIIRYEDNMLQPAVSCKIASTALASRILPPLPTSLNRSITPQRKTSNPNHIVTDEVSSIMELEMYIDRLFEDFNLCELPLSQLKKRLITEYAIVLNPSRLGCVKISDVVRNLSRFNLVCEGNNAYLRRTEESSSWTPSTCVSLCKSAK